MLSIAMDVLAAGIVPFFFVCFGIVWFAFKVMDLFKRK